MSSAQPVFDTKPFFKKGLTFNTSRSKPYEKSQSRLKRIQQSEIIYPESDGKPMADNTIQYKKIVMIKENLERLFENNDNVFIAADLFWYPMKGNVYKKLAPDVMVAFGRPKGDRRSYLQWNEGNIAPHVIFEILSQNNTVGEMKDKFIFYESFGVEEYYVYDPDTIKMEGWIRTKKKLKKIKDLKGWVSPRLQIRFEFSDDLLIYYPDGQKFLSFLELDHERKKEKFRADVAEKLFNLEKRRAEKEKQRAENEKQRAEQEKERADKANRRAKQAEAEMEKLKAKLKELNVQL